MSRDSITRLRQDEDTQAFLGHMTYQANDEPEQKPDDHNRRQSGPEQNPNQQDERKRHKGKKPNRGNRK
jgi:hypothetical protein